MKPMRFFISIAVLLPLIIGCGAEKERVSNLPEANRWIDHLNQDLLPFWSHPEGLGDPLGNFSTFRYDNGKPVDPTVPLAEPYLTLADKGQTWITGNLNKNYVRMISRQAYAFGVAFHMTGESRYLQLAKAGVDFLLNNAFEPSGAIVSWFEDGKPGPNLEHRTSQDMAIALIGPSFYYYLTRDPALLDRIINAKKYFFNTYGGENNWSALKWMMEDYGNQKAEAVYLSGHLDLLPSYMILMTPLLEENEKAVWEEDMSKLADILRQRFYDQDLNVFWGQIDDPKQLKLGGYHVDFGYTSRAFRTLLLIGRITADEDLIKFSEKGALKLLESAFLSDQGAWGEKFAKDGSVVRRNLWWIAAELDVTAAMLALRHDKAARYLSTTYAYWFDQLTDKEKGSVWWGFDTNGNSLVTKANLWKSAFHEFEHALVGYITSGAQHTQSITLYYAFENIPENEKIQPYQLRGTIKDIKALVHPELHDRELQQITFSRVH